MKTIDLEEIFEKYKQSSPNLPGMVDIEYFKSTINVMIFDGIKQALELASENAEYYYGEGLDVHINKQSILDTIKQVK